MIKTTYTLELEGINPKLSEWVDQLVKDAGGHKARTEWRSRYNSYVVFDYEPWCTDGFDIFLVITASSQEKLDFIAHLYNKRIEAIKHLNRCVKK